MDFRGIVQAVSNTFGGKAENVESVVDMNDVKHDLAPLVKACNRYMRNDAPYFKNYIRVALLTFLCIVLGLFILACIVVAIIGISKIWRTTASTTKQALSLAMVIRYMPHAIYAICIVAFLAIGIDDYKEFKTSYSMRDHIDPILEKEWSSWTQIVKDFGGASREARAVARAALGRTQFDFGMFVSDDCDEFCRSNAAKCYKIDPKNEVCKLSAEKVTEFMARVKESIKSQELLRSFAKYALPVDGLSRLLEDVRSGKDIGIGFEQSVRLAVGMVHPLIEPNSIMWKLRTIAPSSLLQSIVVLTAFVSGIASIHYIYYKKGQTVTKKELASNLMFAFAFIIFASNLSYRMLEERESLQQQDAVKMDQLATDIMLDVSQADTDDDSPLSPEKKEDVISKTNQLAEMHKRYATQAGVKGAQPVYTTLILLILTIVAVVAILWGTGFGGGVLTSTRKLMGLMYAPPSKDCLPQHIELFKSTSDESLEVTKLVAAVVALVVSISYAAASNA